MRIAITTGEPAGIGPEISVAGLDAAAQQGVSVTLIGDRDLLEKNGAPASIAIEHVALAAPATAAPGHAQCTLRLATLDRALAGCVRGEFDAMVTAPVHKGVINDAGFAFTGHTEYLRTEPQHPAW